MTLLARARRPALSCTTFIAVTGSCGKSTTVAFADAFLSTLGKCGAEVDLAPGLNAYALLKLDRSLRFWVQEVHAPEPGILAGQLALLKPSVGVVTVIGGDHYKSYRSLEATAREKGLLIEGLPETGVAILNADDPSVLGMAARTRARLITYGCSEDADLRATDISAVWPDRLSFTVTYRGQGARVETQFPGEVWVTSILAAMAAAIACGADLKTCADVSRSVAPIFGRYSIHVRPDGAAFVMDNRKAPVWTITRGLTFVKQARAPRKTTVFGTLSDYPGANGPRYRRVARQALQVSDRVFFVGKHAAHVDRLRQGLPPDRLFVFQTTYQASAYLAETISPGELVYIKGTNKEHLERLMLAQLDQVVCWLEWCGRTKPCAECSKYRIPRQPPLNLAGAGHETREPPAPSPIVERL